jgi:nucleosome assembly protein 1-like 1
VVKEEPCESFFNFFSPPSIPNPEEEELDEEEMEHRQMELESDYEMGIAFQERLIPHAIKWFTGEAEDEDDGYDDEDEEFDEDDMDEVSD